MSIRLLWPDASDPAVLNVTALLERLAGESIRAQVLRQVLTAAERSDVTVERGLWSAGEEVLRRSVLLRGAASGRSFLHATASIAVRRLPLAVSKGLLVSEVPFGRLLHDAQVRITRTDLRGTDQSLGELCSLFDGLPPVARAVRRSYVMRLHDGVAVADLVETFPLSITQAAFVATQLAKEHPSTNA
ncbi:MULTISPECIES: hypothetical protein [Sorangium]|uniref:Chorismate lyase n=1 Tax=Sorangium cellulosum TaxID=56 RepID=A0A4P2QUC3_SORCE|nr:MULTISPECIES: hypothetical protein [Sorangium]AUX33950.1 uncharacterized protein SOCE836_061180 [Sorangium cellulosum]WCQ93260.1 hypothetical protein NQZ70_06008 [Sorangium sp. Soce836]